jgi:hypothetical protein
MQVASEKTSLFVPRQHFCLLALGKVHVLTPPAMSTLGKMLAIRSNLMEEDVAAERALGTKHNCGQ